MAFCKTCLLTESVLSWVFITWINRTMWDELTWAGALQSTLAVAWTHLENKSCLCFEWDSTWGYIYGCHMRLLSKAETLKSAVCDWFIEAGYIIVQGKKNGSFCLLQNRLIILMLLWNLSFNKRKKNCTFWTTVICVNCQLTKIYTDMPKDVTKLQCTRE